jgi:glycerol-3-phosphate acyltransferase PlsY
MTREMLFALALGYLFGSVPFGLILTRLAGKGDVREIGSGNIGATNVLRTGSKVLAALTMILDCLKGTAAVMLASFAFVWLLVFRTIRISSVAGMAGAISAPVTAAVLGDGALFPMLLGFALLILWKHRENILRLRKGTEPRIGRPKTSSTA